MILIISLGAVVRMIAPILVDKKKDPGVLVVDDKGQYVVSVLSGHIGGANALTNEFAQAIDATPIVTTASDVQKQSRSIYLVHGTDGFGIVKRN